MYLRIISFNPFTHEFRQIHEINEEIPPAHTIAVKGHKSGYVENVKLNVLCMTIDPLNGYQDSDYSDNSTCAAIPKPTSVIGWDVGPFDVKVFPNPTQDLISFESKVDFNRYQLLDLFGHCIQSGNIMSNTIALQKPLSGLFLLRLEAGSKFVLKPMVFNTSYSK